MKNATAFSRFLPARPLRAHIAYYWQINLPSPREDDRLELTLPDLYGEIIFNHSSPYLRKNVSSSQTALVEDSTVVGMRTQTTASMRLHARGRLELTGVKLYPWVLAGLTGFSSAELLNQVGTIDDVSGSGLAELEARLFDADNLARRLQLLDEHFLSAIRELSWQERWLQEVLRCWTCAPQKRVRETARKHGVSPRTLERRFVSMLGSPPKKVQRMLRFSAWLAATRLPGHARHEHEQGSFYDQSHLNRECRFFLGATPGQAGSAGMPYTLNTFVA